MFVTVDLACKLFKNVNLPLEKGDVFGSCADFATKAKKHQCFLKKSSEEKQTYTLKYNSERIFLYPLCLSTRNMASLVSNLHFYRIKI